MNASDDSARPSIDRLTVGRLLEHGAAPHEFRPGAEGSYFVKITSDRGVRTFWSPALKHALEKSTTQPKLGDQIGIKENGIDPVEVVIRRRSTEGKPIEVHRYESPRSHWVIEKREWFDERSAAADQLRDPRAHPREAIRNHPELLGAYLTLDSARKFATERFEKLEQRERFLTLVREVLARATERGVPPPVVRVRDRAPLPEASPEHDLTR